MYWRFLRGTGENRAQLMSSDEAVNVYVIITMSCFSAAAMLMLVMIGLF